MSKESKGQINTPYGVMELLAVTEGGGLNERLEIPKVYVCKHIESNIRKVFTEDEMKEYW